MKDAFTSFHSSLDQHDIYNHHQTFHPPPPHFNLVRVYDDRSNGLPRQYRSYPNMYKVYFNTGFQ